jgi:hypothetical protein
LIKSLIKHRNRNVNLLYGLAPLNPAHFILSEFGLRGSALVAFQGPCRVETDHLVDWEDRLEGDRIESRLMVHFLGEFFVINLREGVLMQRLLMAQMAERLGLHLRTQADESRRQVVRSGNDLYWAERKLSVSIVTASPVSVLLHAGVNVDPTGAPVAAVGLNELGVDASDFARGILESFSREMTGVDWACAKVRPVV